MNILIVGCGKVGSELAKILENENHEVSVVAASEKELEKLDSFNGFTTVGVYIDEDVLTRAGIANCDAIAVVTDNDNINLMVSQMATKFYKVQKVIARVFENQKETMFEHFNIQTICSTAESVNKIYYELFDFREQNMVIGETKITTCLVNVENKYIGKLLKDINIDDGKYIYGILKKNKKFIFSGNASEVIIEKNDRIVINKHIS
ncbi:MAG: potassium channel family protein [Oscillospiraceae bacterium]